MTYTLGILTGGGDAPGLNAYLHAVDRAGRRLGWKVVGIRNGFDGLLRPDRYPDGGVVELRTLLRPDDLIRSGTVLGAASSGFPALNTELARDLASMLRAAGLDVLLIAGGDGSQRIAAQLSRVGFPVIGLPKTIDNDLGGVTGAVGFDSALDFLVDAAVALRAHAEAHRRVLLLETMGRNSGFLALATALASGADAVLLPEFPYDPVALRLFVTSRFAAGAGSLLVVVAEGAHAMGTAAPGSEGLGGVSATVAAGLDGLEVEVRSVVPAHIQRGTAPSVSDRLRALRLGAAAVTAAAAGRFGILLDWTPDGVVEVPFADRVAVRCLDPDAPDLRTARALGIFLGF